MRPLHSGVGRGLFLGPKPLDLPTSAELPPGTPSLDRLLTPTSPWRSGPAEEELDGEEEEEDEVEDRPVPPPGPGSC